MKEEAKNIERPSINWEESVEIFSRNLLDIPESERWYGTSSGQKFYLVLTKAVIGDLADKSVVCWLGKNTSKEDVLNHNEKVFAKIFDDGEQQVGVLCKSKWEKW